MQIQIERSSALLPVLLETGSLNWYAVHTKARHEKRVAAQFEEKQVCTFLPLLRRIHRWTDRRVEVDVPLFSCYAFVRVAQTSEERLKILRTPSVLGFVGSDGHGTPVPDEEIEGLQRLIAHDIPCFPYPYLCAGRRVRVRGGSLDGIEGVLMSQGADQSLVVSVHLLQRSVAVRVEGYDIELA